MLISLTIRNYALIDHLELSFQDGFTSITGETGAGKSILLGALGLILGNRADLRVLQDPDQKCVVEGVFDTRKLNLSNFFNENDLDEEPETHLRREISPTGKSRAFINDTPVNLSQMKELGEQLVDIHSQHETLQLSDATFQLEVLDGFIRRDGLKTAYRKAYQQWKEETQQLEQLKQQYEDDQRQVEFMQYQYDELEKSALQDDEYESLESKALFLNHAGEIQLSLSQAIHILDEQDSPVLTQLQQIQRGMEKISSAYPEASSYAQRLQSVVVELKDLLGDFQTAASDANFDPQELMLVEERMDLISRLMHKHHVQTTTELIAIRDELAGKLAGINLAGDNILALERQLGISLQAVKAKASEWHDARLEEAARMSASVQDQLPLLGMKDAVFEVRVTMRNQFGPAGADEVTYWFSANKGIAPGEISRMASGGELSRLMLAIKALVTSAQMLPTVIFDEIDNGVSGDIAGKVGQLMYEMAGHHQVLAITHLPQIAGAASHQLKVFKTVAENKTTTQIASLSHEMRIQEIAGMISGKSLTDAALQAARELLKN